MLISNDFSENCDLPPAQPRRVKKEPLTPAAQRLISAATEAFAQKGILGARVAEITAAAGTKDAAFYRYFPSLRDAALFIMSEYYWRPLNHRLEHFFEVTHEPGQLFEAVVTALIHSTEDDPSRPWLAESKVFRIVVSQLRNPFLLPDSLRDPQYESFLGKLEGILSQGQKKGCFMTGISGQILARALVTTTHGLLVDAALEGQNPAVAEESVRRVAFQLVGFQPADSRLS
jgi:AcrR family transcriptional regulator